MDGLTVCVIDDDLAVRRGLTRLLEVAGTEWKGTGLLANSCGKAPTAISIASCLMSACPS